MNHGRWNAPVKYCPTCGDSVNKAATGSCSHASHAELRKNRFAFCTSCGTKLALN